MGARAAGDHFVVGDRYRVALPLLGTRFIREPE
jgi:hypothetical protein